MIGRSSFRMEAWVTAGGRSPYPCRLPGAKTRKKRKAIMIKSKIMIKKSSLLAEFRG